MKKSLGFVIISFIVILLYLLFAPVPISPQPWDAPQDQGYTGVFEPNMDLASLEELPLPDGIYGPEDVTEMRGQIYVTSQNGWVFRYDAQAEQFHEFAYTGGKPLGIEARDDALFVADAYKGLLKIDAQGQITTLSNSVNNSPIIYADDLDITDSGVIYFSDASTKFGAEAIGSTLGASLLEIMEHGETGRVLVYNPQDSTTRVISEGLSFSNGVAVAPNGMSVWVVETGKYRILEIDPDGTRRVVIDNLPGFPDNINRGPNGTYFVGLVSKRATILDKLSNRPFLRKMIWRLPEFLKPAPQDYGFILQLARNGDVLRTWQDPSAGYPGTTGAVVIDGRLYVSSLTSKTLGYLPYR